MRQKDERENNINRVISAAQSLFISDGIYATSINRIAQEAGLTPMSLYRYFNNKDTLVYTVWQDALATFFKQFMDEFELRTTPEMTGYDKFVVAMDIYFEIYRKSPNWFSYTQEMFSYAPSDKNSGKEIIVIWRTNTRRIFHWTW